MNIKLFVVLAISVLSVFAHANSEILKQGDINVLLQDLDGYAYKIPIEHRGEYFNSILRLEKALFSILNMKHIAKYGRSKGLVDENQVINRANERILEYFPNSINEFNLEQENKIITVKNFLKYEEAYKQTQNKLRENINEEELIELAREKYIVNKNLFVEVEERTLDFISFVYNKNNRKEQGRRIKKAFEVIGDDTNKFNKFKNDYHNKDVDIEIHEGVKFKYNYRDEKYSDQIFSIDEPGVLPLIINYNSRFVLTNVTNIKAEKTKSFDEVKEGIMQNLKKEAAERQFNTLLISLTKDEVEINEKALSGLKERYISIEQ